MSGYLIDNSVWARYKQNADIRASIRDIDDVIYTCTPSRVEFLYSAKSLGDYISMLNFLNDVGVLLEPPPDLDAYCIEIQANLAALGKLRAVGAIDIMLAAYAICYRLVLLHYDSDFSDHLAEAMPELQQCWIVPRGSIS